MLTSLFVLLSENAHSWSKPECNTAMCYCLTATLPSVFGVRCHKQCNTTLGRLCFTTCVSLGMKCNTVHKALLLGLHQSEHY